MRSAADDRGSALAEFALLLVPVVLFAGALFQTGLILHTRTSLAQVAAEAARHGALAGRSAADAESHAQRAADRHAGDLIRSVRAGQVSGPAGPMIRVEITFSVPLAGLGPAAGSMTVRGHALAEDGP